jgi:hypothetical protein
MSSPGWGPDAAAQETRLAEFLAAHPGSEVTPPGARRSTWLLTFDRGRVEVTDVDLGALLDEAERIDRER